MSKNEPGKSDKGKGKAPTRPQSPEEESDPEARAKPYKCPRCNRRYTSKGHMTRHAKGSHGIDYTGPEIIEWDTLETFEFRAQQAAAQRRKRRNRAARRAAEAGRQGPPGPAVQSRASGMPTGWENVFVPDFSHAQVIPTVRGKRTVRDTATQMMR